MAQFNIDNSLSPPQESGPAPHLPEAVRRGLPVGPRLVGGTSFTGKSALDTAQVQLLAQACLQGLDAARQVVFGWQRQGQSLQDIYLQGIAPCARRLGQWWSEDRLDFAMTTIACAHLQQLLHDFSAEFLQEAPQSPTGWTVTVGVPQDVAEFKRRFQSEWFDVVGISVSTDRHLDTLATLLPQLKAGADNLSLRLFVGGPMALREPVRLRGIAAEMVAEDAPTTVTRITHAMRSEVSSAS